MREREDNSCSIPQARMSTTGILVFLLAAGSRAGEEATTSRIQADGKKSICHDEKERRRYAIIINWLPQPNVDDVQITFSYNTVFHGSYQNHNYNGAGALVLAEARYSKHGLEYVCTLISCHL